MLCIHAVGMAVLVGVVLVVSARVLGLASAIPLDSFAGFVRLARLAFCASLISGVLLLISRATIIFSVWQTPTKLALIVVGGFTFAALWKAVTREDNRSGAFAFINKVLAVCSMILWISTIAMGRLIAYAQ